ncbi:MAG: hypothetical protein WD696_15855 [Bryobacteraceae bacterium]
MLCRSTLRRCLLSALCIVVSDLRAQQESYLGSLTPVISAIQKEQGFPLAFAERKGMPVEEWRRRARAEVELRLGYAPRPVPLDLKVHSREKRDGYELRVVSFAGSPFYRIPAFLLIPAVGRPPYPGVVALHDHGGYFYHGKEKIVEGTPDHPALVTFKKQYYGGRSWASELARRGFVVLVTDAFYWGDRRIQYRSPPPNYQKLVAGLTPDQPEYVAAVNRYLREASSVLNTWMDHAGTNWLGIVQYDDRRSVDLLASIPEVAPGRIGCAGLSIGGYRATYLAGMDPRIRAAVIVGWMTTLPTTLDLPHAAHPNLLSPFGLHTKLDHPDVASLAAPESAMFVQQCALDRLFTRAGMQQAAEKIGAVYAALGKPERYRSKFYDVPHQFNAEMQEEAFDWLDKWLNPAQ